MATIKYLKDVNNDRVYPVTHERAVRDSSGVTLESKLQSLETNTYSLAWDGTSAPVVANIPRGVTVTYDETTYTGTKTASASTTGAIYLVSNGSGYDRYITSQSRSTYSWTPLGSTDMTLRVVDDDVTGGSGVAWSAERGKQIRDDFVALDRDYSSVEDLTVVKTELTLTDYTVYNYQLLNTGKWGTNSSYKHINIPVRTGEIYMLTAGTGAAQLGWLTTTGTPGQNTVADLLDGTTRFDIPAETTVKLTVPEGAYYLYVYVSTDWESQYIPSSIVNIRKAQNVDFIGKDINNNEEIELLANTILNPEDYDITEVDMSLEAWVNKKQVYSLISTTGVYGTGTSYTHLRIPVSEGDYIKVKTQTDYYCVHAFLKSFSSPISGGVVDVVPGYPVWNARRNSEIIYKVPEGCCAFACYAGRSNDSYPYMPERVVIYHPKDKDAKDRLSPEEVKVFLASKWNFGAPPEEVDERAGRTFAVKEGVTYSIRIVTAANDSASGTIYAGVFDSWPHRHAVKLQNENITFYGPLHIFQFTANTDGYFCLSSGWAIREFDVQIGGYQSVEDASIEGHLADKAEYVNTLNKDIVKLIKSAYSFNTVDLSVFTKRSRWINSVGHWNSTASCKHVLVPVSPGGYIQVTANPDKRTYLAWLASDAAPSNNGIPDFAPGLIMYFNIEPGANKLFRIPEGANYLYVYTTSSEGNNMAPQYLGISAPKKDDEGSNVINNGDLQLQTLRSRIENRATTLGLVPAEIPVDANGWEIPRTLQQLNVVKRALQLIRLKWTPITTVPGKKTAHAAGVQQTKGIPYSGNWHDFKYVGIEVSIHTFMTAVHNPYSLMYTENVSASGSASAWGRTYYNTNGWAYYGTVCCGFSSAVVGLPLKYGNDRPRLISRYNGLFVPVYPQTVDGLQIGDICDGSTHALVVTGLHRDANGKVDQVRIAESTSSIEGCHTGLYNTPDKFYNGTIRRSKGPMQIYRCAELYKNIDYEPSPYVPLTDYGEPEQTVTYNDDICCFAGDKATFMKGNRVAINYNLTDNPSHEWTLIELYKDDTLLSTYNLSEIDQTALDASQQNHALDLGTTLAPGKYKARMSDGVNKSDYTYFEVLTNDITISDLGGGAYRIKVNSTTDRLVVVCAGDMDANNNYFVTSAYREPDWAEAQDNEMVLYYDDLLSYFEKEPSLYNKVRINIKGDYGIAVTYPITLPNRESGEGEGTDSDGTEEVDDDD